MPPSHSFQHPAEDRLVRVAEQALGFRLGGDSTIALPSPSTYDRETIGKASVVPRESLCARFLLEQRPALGYIDAKPH